MNGALESDPAGARLEELARLRHIISDRDAEIARLRFDMEHDKLTGLLNRAGMEEVLRTWIMEGATTITVLFLDLDHFKQVNDEKGHAAGDEVLVSFSVALKRTAYVHRGRAIRLGGDEFVVIIPGNDSEVAADTCLAQGKIAISVGVAIGPPERMSELMHWADVAMYRSKDEEGSTFTMWTTECEELPAPVSPAGDRRRRTRTTRVRKVVSGQE
jgi:GGDEF domain-containing protein